MKNSNSFQMRLLYTTIVLFSVIALQAQTVSDSVKVDESILKTYVGRYDYTQGAVLLVTLEGNQLEAQLTGQPKFPIYPSSKNEFYWKVVDATVKFVTDEKGNVTHAIHNQNGSQFDAMKLKDETPVSVNPGIFDKYVGRYNVADYSTLVVTKEGDKLMATGDNLPPYQLLPASETEFFLREANARLTFNVTGAKAESILINMAGNEMRATRIGD